MTDAAAAVTPIVSASFLSVTPSGDSSHNCLIAMTVLP